jgi:hypothetical protein
VESGFGPRLSRVAAGICLLAFLGALEYFFGPWVMLATVMLPVLLALLLTVSLPHSSRKRRVIRLVAGSVDIGKFFFERLDDRFENLTRRPKR